MSKKKSLMPLAAITTVLFLAVITRPSPDATSRDTAGAPMLPDLKANAEAIDGITIRQGGVALSLQRDGGQWYCASAADYPVEWDRIRKLLVQLDQLERWEAKTQDPARHAAVDLDTSIQEGQAIEIELSADSDLVSHVVLGKQQWSPKSTFARLATEDQTFKCKGHVEVELNPVAWLDTTLCTLERSGITQMNFGPMELVRPNDSPEGGEPTWQVSTKNLESVPDKALQLAKADLPSWPTRLTFEDVLPRNQHQWSSDTVVMTYGAQEGQLTVSLDLSEEEDPVLGADWILSQRQDRTSSRSGVVGRGGCTDSRTIGSHRSDRSMTRCGPARIFRMRDQTQGPNFKVLRDAFSSGVGRVKPRARGGIGRRSGLKIRGSN